MTRRRASLTVVMAIHEMPGMAACALEALRPHADEIIVAADSRMPPDEVSVVAPLADNLLRFEFTSANRFLPWLTGQARGDWLLQLSGDEMPGAALLEALPSLIGARAALGYKLPVWWVAPDASGRLGGHFDRDWQHRLVRNSRRLVIPGTKHTGLHLDAPDRAADTPILHLALAAHDVESRRQKVRRYEAEAPGMTLPEGRPLNAAYYLPEDDPDLLVRAIGEADRAMVARALGRRTETAQAGPGGSPVVGAQAIEAHWDGRAWAESDYAAVITIGDVAGAMTAGSEDEVTVTVRHAGRGTWPGVSRPAGVPQVGVSSHWRKAGGATLAWDGPRFVLPHHMWPGDEITIRLPVSVPSYQGAGILEVDLVREGDRWFGSAASVPVTIRARSDVGGDPEPTTVAAERDVLG